ncbi:YncE family protein [Gordonia sp. (in: high G+C Gram-positive bacteria)]|uniref:YncE family protein n=1 Tax=Gordonia sp. (in: high G+C Gram-positive bacteria) TaxID=84139 RepID=UPI0039E40776
MTSRLNRTAPLAGVALAAALSLGSIVAPHAAAAPSPARPGPAVPQPAGYTIKGYSVGVGNERGGNYRGSIDPQTGDLWMTQAEPMSGATRSDLLKIDPNTMTVKKRFSVIEPANTGGHGKYGVQYEIKVPKTGNVVWTTAAAANGGEANVWDKTTGKRVARLTNLSHAHWVDFAEGLRVAIVSTTSGLSFFDMDTYARLGDWKFPGSGKKLGAGFAITNSDANGATVSVTSYYRDLSQLRITRSGGKVATKLNWNTRQSNAQGHGNVAADTRTNRLYVNNLMTPAAGLSVYNLTTGKHIADVNTGIGTNSLLIFQGKLYAANYFLGFISVVDQKTFAVQQVMTTGLLPNHLLAWKKNTFLVIDKNSSAAELPGGMLKIKSPPLASGDYVFKVTKH